MRKEYKSILKKLFAERLKVIAPEYEEIKVKNPVYSGQSTFMWSPCEGISCFIILVPNPKGDDSYTIEVGWNNSEEFPRITQGSWITIYKPTIERKEFDLPICICRLGSIYEGKDIWWSIGKVYDVTKVKFEDYSVKQIPIPINDAINDVRNSLDNSMRILVDHGLAYLNDFVKRNKSICGS